MLPFIFPNVKVQKHKGKTLLSLNDIMLLYLDLNIFPTFCKKCYPCLIFLSESYACNFKFLSKFSLHEMNIIVPPKNNLEEHP